MSKTLLRQITQKLYNIVVWVVCFKNDFIFLDDQDLMGHKKIDFWVVPFSLILCGGQQ